MFPVKSSCCLNKEVFDADTVLHIQKVNSTIYDLLSEKCDKVLFLIVFCPLVY